MFEAQLAIFEIIHACTPQHHGFCFPSVALWSLKWILFRRIYIYIYIYIYIAQTVVGSLAGVLVQFCVTFRSGIGLSIVGHVTAYLQSAGRAAAACGKSTENMYSGAFPYTAVNSPAGDVGGCKG